MLDDVVKIKGYNVTIVNALHGLLDNYCTDLYTNFQFIFVIPDTEIKTASVLKDTSDTTKH